MNEAMKTNKNQENEAGAEKRVRAVVRKHRLRIGDFIYALDAEVTLSLAEYELRKAAGEVELIEVI
jgi:hypothetical protein